MGDDQRQDATGALEPPGEDEPHHEVADEPAEALVQVVAPPQQRARPQCLTVRPTHLTEPGQQVSDNDDLLQSTVLGSLEEKERHAIPGVRDVHHCEGGAHAELMCGPDQDQARYADERGEAGTLEQLSARGSTEEPDPETSGPRVAREQHEHQQDRHDALHQPRQVVGDVEPHVRGLSPGSNRCGRRRDATLDGQLGPQVAQQGVYAGQPERDAQDSQHLQSARWRCSGARRLG